MAEFLGMDHGFKNMKTAHCVFPTALTKLKALPDDLSGVITYKNEHYSIYGSPLVSVNNHDKVQNMDFYILTLAAAAKELKSRGKHNAQIRLAVGLPQKWYLQQKQSFKNYLFKESIVKFEFEGEKYKLEILATNVYTQGLAAVFSKLPVYKDKYFVIVDIGGETLDIIAVRNGKAIQNECKIVTKAMNWLLNEIREAIESEMMETVHTDVIQDYILSHTKKNKPENKYEEIISEELRKYSNWVFTALREFKINTELTPLVFVGGGSEVVQHFGEFGKNVEFVTDICANAKGYETIDRLQSKKEGK